MSVDTYLPKVIFGTSSLGNLFVELDAETKANLVGEAIKHSTDSIVFDSAGKYGAGLALESLAESLERLEVAPEAIRISNKLGWKRVPLTTPEPTFEPGAWVNLKHDAVQDISYTGILECYAQGNELLDNYNAQIVSVHDPDEYLAAAINDADLQQRKQDILDAYRALIELRDRGEVESVGIGAKDVSVIDFVSDHVDLDWTMFACSVTPYRHSPSTLKLLKKLGQKNIQVINSAVFNAGFLLGSDMFDYQKVDRQTHPDLYQWRDGFNESCNGWNILPAEACVQFSFLFKEIVAVALSTSTPEKVKKNIALAEKSIPAGFWQEMKEKGLINISL